jgi:hypothetical protein
MRNKDIEGYINFFLGIFFFYGLDYQIIGLFFQGMALGCFIGSIIDQVKEKRGRK